MQFTCQQRNLEPVRTFSRFFLRNTGENKDFLGSLAIYEIQVVDCEIPSHQQFFHFRKLFTGLYWQSTETKHTVYVVNCKKVKF